MRNVRRRNRTLIAASVLALGIGATVAFAVLPVTDVPPAAVPIGTLAGATPLNVLSVDSFTRAINQAHGTVSVLQHLRFAPGQSTGWHTHAGPNIVMVVAGSFTLIDEHCVETQYGPGQGFATGIDAHEAIAGPGGADFYSLDFFPADATTLRTNESAPVCARR